MKDVGTVHVLEGLEELVHGVLLVDVLEDAGPDDGVEVSLHVLEDQVDVPVIVSLQHVQQLDDVLVPMQLLQEHDLPEGPLGISGILEGIKDLLEGHCLPSLLVDSLPHYTICL